MGEYNGLYHSLNGLISPMDGVGPDNLTIDLLEKRLEFPLIALVVSGGHTVFLLMLLEGIFRVFNI